MKVLISAEMKQHLIENLQSNKNLYVFNGVMLIILGVIALLAPLVIAEFLSLLIGCIFLLAGLAQGVVSYATKRHWTYYITAIIALTAGIILILKPEVGALVLAMVISVFLLLQGSMQIFYAGVFAPFKGWGWMLLSGCISILLTILIYVGWPTTAIWFLGVVVGLNLILFGVSLLMLATWTNRI